MKWKLLLTVAVFGLIMGLLSLFGLTRGIEPFLWIAIALGAAWWLARTISAGGFLHGLFAGILMGIGNSIMQSLFIQSYLSSNPESAGAFDQIPGDLSPRLFVLLTGPLVGLIYGLFLGTLTLIAMRLRKRGDGVRPPT